MNPQEINILIGCEESQNICKEFRKLGFNAYSCDLKPCSGGHPEWHIHGDVKKAIHNHFVYAQDGSRIDINIWHAAIFHPDCTYLTVSGLHWNGRISGRAEKTEMALQFVCYLLNAPIKYISLENPIGCISTRVFKYVGWFGELEKAVYKVFPTKTKGLQPTQIIQPYHFGEDASKATCLWNIGFPKLIHTSYFNPRIFNGKKRWANQTDSGQNKLAPSANRAELRSKTYPGIAYAIAQQWGKFLIENL